MNIYIFYVYIFLQNIMNTQMWRMCYLDIISMNTASLVGGFLGKGWTEDVIIKEVEVNIITRDTTDLRRATPQILQDILHKREQDNVKIHLPLTMNAILVHLGVDDLLKEDLMEERRKLRLNPPVVMDVILVHLQSDNLKEERRKLRRNPPVVMDVFLVHLQSDNLKKGIRKICQMESKKEKKI